MTPFDYRQFYRRNLPHVHSPGSTLFVTFRLVDSVPQSVVQGYRSERASREKELSKLDPSNQRDVPSIEFHRRWFLEFDRAMDKAESGPMWLSRPDVRSIVQAKLIEGDGPKYRLDAFSIMSNHVHVVFRPNLDERMLTETRRNGRIVFEAESETLAEIMQSLKGSTARHCNQVLGRKGQFWEHESFDHEIRDYEGFVRVVRYTLNNPVKAGLVERPMQWPGNYLAERLKTRPEFRDLIDEPPRK